MAAHDATGLWALIERERAALLAAGHAQVRVVTCYEAGRDGFWLHRFLVAQGAASQVVDPGSILVNRRARLAGLRCAGGAPLPAHLREEIARVGAA